MSSPRLRRLRLDYERLMERFRNWPLIQVTGLEGDPPERYQVTYRLRGLYATPSGQLLERDNHVVEINLSLGYPRRAPQCKMLTPIFHPNFDAVSVCIGDFWAASEGLDDLIVRIGRMIAWQEYNTRSPLNGLAARWADQHAHMLPVDPTEPAPPLAEVPGATEEKVVVQFSAPEAAPAELPPELPAAVQAQSRPQSTTPPRLDFGVVGMTLVSERVTLGRASENTIQLNDSTISAFHAEILRTGEGSLLRDLGSFNGCTVNGATATETWLQNGDDLTFGGIKARFLR